MNIEEESPSKWEKMVFAGSGEAAGHCINFGKLYLRAEIWQDKESIEEMPKAVSAYNACAGLSLPSDVPVGALREVVGALRAILVCMRSAYDDYGVSEPDEEYVKASLILAKINPPPQTDKGPEIDLPLGIIFDKVNN